MFLLAQISWDPAIIAGWLVAGLIAAWLGTKFTEDASYGLMGDLVAGGVGGLVGGLAYGFFKNDAGFWGGALVAFGAAAIVFIGGRTLVATKNG